MIWFKQGEKLPVVVAVTLPSGTDSGSVFCFPAAACLAASCKPGARHVTLLTISRITLQSWIKDIWVVWVLALRDIVFLTCPNLEKMHTCLHYHLYGTPSLLGQEIQALRSDGWFCHNHYDDQVMHHGIYNDNSRSVVWIIYRILGWERDAAESSVWTKPQLCVNCTGRSIPLHTGLLVWPYSDPWHSPHFQKPCIFYSHVSFQWRCNTSEVSGKPALHADVLNIITLSLWQAEAQGPQSGEVLHYMSKIQPGVL
jgi:hypothetical protein